MTFLYLILILMAGKPRKGKSARIVVHVTDDTAEFIAALGKEGRYFGNSDGEIGAALLEDYVIQLIENEFLEKRQKAFKRVKKTLGKNF